MSRLKDYPHDWPVTAARHKAAAGWRCVRCGHGKEAPWKAKYKNVLLPPRVGLSICTDHCVPLYHKPDEHKNRLRIKGGGTRLAPQLIEQVPQRVLTVHHLDGDKKNGRWWNCPPLCQKCHLEVQAKVVMGQQYLGEHSEWFKPYLAGYLAFQVSKEDLTRDQVAADLPRLLKLEGT